MGDYLSDKATLRTKPKRYFVDPSMAAAAVRATPQGLLADTKTFGLLFESLVMRDLRVYAQSFGAEMRYYQDSTNRIELTLLAWAGSVTTRL